MNVPKDIGFSSGSLSPAIAIKGRKAHKSMVRVLLFINNSIVLTYSLWLAIKYKDVRNHNI